MKNIRAKSIAILAILSAELICATSAIAESSNYQPVRMPNGKPSLQGVWSNASITTLERPAKYSELVIPEALVAELTREHPQVVRQRTDDNLDQADGLLDGSDLAKGRGYNAFWIDPGKEFGLVKGSRRTSWIVEPVDGKMPLNQAGRQLLQALASRSKSDFSGPESRPPAERCLIIGGRVGPPMVNGLYNNNYQFVQTDDYLVIWVEMVSHVRIIPLHGAHNMQGIKPLFGESRGHWQGDSLVVETTNFSNLQQESPIPLSTHAKVTEKFTRVSDQQIFYEFTIDDPIYYSQPWRGEMSLNKQTQPVFEYACHEGNYALEGILAGARHQEPTRAH